MQTRCSSLFLNFFGNNRLVIMGVMASQNQRKSRSELVVATVALPLSSWLLLLWLLWSQFETWMASVSVCCGNTASRMFYDGYLEKAFITANCRFMTQNSSLLPNCHAKLISWHLLLANYFYIVKHSNSSWKIPSKELNSIDKKSHLNVEAS